MRKLAATLALFLLPAATLASTIVGNPNTKVSLVDGSNVYVHSVKAYRCTTGYQLIPVDATLDQWEAADIVLEEDDFCDVVVRVRWTPGGTIKPVAVTGFDTLEISKAGELFEIELDASASSATIN